MNKMSLLKEVMQPSKNNQTTKQTTNQPTKQTTNQTNKQTTELGSDIT